MAPQVPPPLPHVHALLWLLLRLRQPSFSGEDHHQRQYVRT